MGGEKVVTMKMQFSYEITKKLPVVFVIVWRIAEWNSDWFIYMCFYNVTQRKTEAPFCMEFFAVKAYMFQLCNYTKYLKLMLE